MTTDSSLQPFRRRKPGAESNHARTECENGHRVSTRWESSGIASFPKACPECGGKVLT